MLLLLAILFIATVSVGVILVSPNGTERMLRLISQCVKRSAASVRTRLVCVRDRVWAALSSHDGLVRHAYLGALHHRLLICVLAGLCTCAAAGLLLRSSPTVVAGYERTIHQVVGREGNVLALLGGEHLVAPSPLPPAIFATREVELVRPKLATASRAWHRLDDAFAQRLLRAYQLMKERHGYDMTLIEGYRSPERQQELAALGPHVTRAGAFQCYHQYGLAADSAFVRDGKLVISERDEWAMRGYELFGDIAASLGLTWGGSWKMRDLGHVELRARDL